MLTRGDQAPQVSLPRRRGSPSAIDWAGDGLTLVVFVSSDCPTCALILPYLDRLAAELVGQASRVVVIAQDDEPLPLTTADRLPVLIDHELDVSRRFDPVAVPCLFLVAAGGAILRSHPGFDKSVLNEIAGEICRHHGREAPVVADEFDGRPASKPGCGSRHLEPAAGGTAVSAVDVYSRPGTRASRLELTDDVDPYEYCRKMGFADPLPVVPPTAERVDRMLAVATAPPEETIAHVPPNYGAATIEKIAANAVMAGCTPEMMRLLPALVRAACDERLNLHGVQATTHFAAPLILINGSVRRALGFACAQNVFSNVSRANSTLGRALQLILRNLGGASPESIDMSTLGNSAKFSCCIAENEEASPWEPYHVDRGLDRERSALTLFAAEPPRGVSEHTARTAEGVLRSLSRTLSTVRSYRDCRVDRVLVVLGPEHARTIGGGGLSKQEARDWLFENTGVPKQAYEVKDGGEGTGLEEHYEEVTIDGLPCYRKFRDPGDVHIVVAGGTAGKFSAVMGGWGGSTAGSEPVTYPVE